MRHALYKYFSERRWADQFLEGEILFRSLSYFRAYEDQVRGDVNEGASVYRPPQGLIIHNQTRGTTSVLPNSAFVSAAKQNEIFVFCLSRANSAALAEEFKAVTCVEVRDIPSFCSRVEAALPQGATFLAKRVVYYDSAEGGDPRWALPDRIAISKLKSYEQQQEFRLVFTLNEAFAFENVDTRLVFGEGSTTRPAPQEYRLKVKPLKDMCGLANI